MLGLDLLLFSAYAYYRGYGYYPILTVAANMAILATLLLTNIIVYSLA